MKIAYAQGVRTAVLTAAFLAVSLPLRAEQAPSFMDPAVRPAYQVVQGLSDGVYNVLRHHLIGSLLPDRLTRSMGRPPRADSYGLFTAELKKKQGRLMRRLSASYPLQDKSGLRSGAQLADWQARLQEEQVGVVLDSLGDSLVDRYQMEAFGRSSGKYAADRRNWDPAFLTMAGLLGSTFLYLNGLHTDAVVKRFRVGIDVRAGSKLQRALRTGTGSRLAAVELSYRDFPVSLHSDWGLKASRLASEQIGVRYALKY